VTRFQSRGPNSPNACDSSSVYTLPVPRISISRWGAVVLVVSTGMVVVVVEVVEVHGVVGPVVPVVEGVWDGPATSSGVAQAATRARSAILAATLMHQAYDGPGVQEAERITP
jgi:hypothetical protein